METTYEFTVKVTGPDREVAREIIEALWEAVVDTTIVSAGSDAKVVVADPKMTTGVIRETSCFL